jgi:hypothetical protein
LAAALASNADSAAMRECGQVALFGQLREERRREAVKRKPLEYIGRTGEVVAIVGVERFGALGFHHAENFSSAVRSSW